MTKAYSYARFSTAEQRKGSSLRRQLQWSQEVAAKRNLQLVEDYIVDQGISGWKGQNVTIGAWARSSRT